MAVEGRVKIRRLEKDNVADWFDFFENRGFQDHGEWKGCYCTAFFYPKPKEYPAESNRRRDYAAWLMETGRMRGYLAYVDETVVGWVNANDRNLFPRLGESTEPERILSIVCFLVEKAHRGQGVGTRLLNQVLADAKTDGYSLVEAYPKKGAKSEYGRWNGPFEMYQKAGFVEVPTPQGRVVRKPL